MKKSYYFLSHEAAITFMDSVQDAESVMMGSVAKEYIHLGNFVVTVIKAETVEQKPVAAAAKNNPKTLVNPESFVKTGEITIGSSVFDEGTIEVTLRGETKRVEARFCGSIGYIAFGLIGRYQTGAKQWPATIRHLDGQEIINFGRDDRSGRFNKVNCIWFEK